MKRKTIEPKRLVLAKERIRVLGEHELEVSGAGTRTLSFTTKTLSTTPLCDYGH